MNQFLRPFLELTVILPGMFLAYLPVSSYLRQKPSETDSLAFSPASGALYFRRFSVLFLSNFNATRSFSSAATAPVSLSQDTSDLHLEVRQYFSGCLRGFCLHQQPFPGGKCHYNCQPQSDRKRTVVSDQIRPLLQRNLFKLRSGYLVSCLPCGKKYDRR